MLRSSAIPVSDPSAGLRITEIFYSLQGEADTAGLPTVFIRLTGCPLRCSYCDTTYSFEGGERQSLEDIIQKTNCYFLIDDIKDNNKYPIIQVYLISLKTFIFIIEKCYLGSS